MNYDEEQHDGLPDHWSEEQCRLFHRIYRHMLANQKAFAHPAALAVADAHWSTTAWNAAWFAAHCREDESDFVVHVEEDGEVFAAEIQDDALQ